MKIKSLLIVSLAGAFGLCSAYAQSITYYSDSQDLTATYQTFTVPKFDPALGTLTGVTVFTTDDVGNFVPVGPTINGSVKITNNAGVTLTIDNYFAQFQTRQVTSGAGYSNTFDDIDPVVTSPSMVGATIASGNNQTYTLTSGQTFDAVSQSIGSGFFATYIGATGTVDFEARAPQTVATAGTNYTVENNTTTPLVFGVTYSYIPEPSTAMLVGLASMGLLLRRRRP